MNQSERIAKLRDSLSLAVEIYKANRCDCQKLREHLYHDWFNSAITILDDTEREGKGEIIEMPGEAPPVIVYGRRAELERRIEEQGK